jgi:hypothetical protein
MLKNYCGENGVLTGEVTMILDDEGIKAHSQWSRTLYYWSTIQDIAQSKNLIYLFYDNSLAQIFPKRIFDSPKSIEGFLSFIDNKRASVKPAHRREV